MSVAIDRHKGTSLGFCRLQCTATPAVAIGFYDEAGGTTGEFTIEWIDLGSKIVPVLRVFSDGWSALNSMPGFRDALAAMDGRDPTIDRVCQVLTELGFKDLTKQPAGIARWCPVCGRVAKAGAR